MFDGAGIIDGADVEVHVLDEHHTTADSHIPGVVARKGRRRKGSGGQRHGDGKLPHNRFPFQLRFTSRQTSYSSLWFHASQQIANLLPKSRTLRSEERRVGKECVRKCRTGGSPLH